MSFWKRIFGGQSQPTPGEGAQCLVDRPPGAKPLSAVKSYTEDELARMGAFEVRLPSGDGRCSDNDCPCQPPGTPIPHGKGFLYIDAAVVDFRADARTNAALKRKAARLQADIQQRGPTLLHDPAVYKTITVCEQGARRQGLDEALKRQAARIQADFQRRGATMLHDPAVYQAILMCEQGARKRGLDLKVAAGDARLAWAEGRAPLRATPKSAS